MPLCAKLLILQSLRWFPSKTLPLHQWRLERTPTLSKQSIPTVPTLMIMPYDDLQLTICFVEAAWVFARLCSPYRHYSPCFYILALWVPGPMACFMSLHCAIFPLTRGPASCLFRLFSGKWSMTPDPICLSSSYVIYHPLLNSHKVWDTCTQYNIT